MRTSISFTLHHPIPLGLFLSVFLVVKKQFKLVDSILVSNIIFGIIFLVLQITVCHASLRLKLNYF